MKTVIAMLMLVSCIGWAANEAAIAPSQNNNPVGPVFSFAGRLTADDGTIVPDGNYRVTFRLYRQENGGESYWSETQTVTVKQGLFFALLGTVNPIPFIPDDGNSYLSLQVGGESELSPRLRIVSAPYAYFAKRADTANYVAMFQSDNDTDWVRGTPDSVLFTVRQLGIARGGSQNQIFGNLRYTHINLGNKSQTGTLNLNEGYCTVGGGYYNAATKTYATVAGGDSNFATGPGSTIGGGKYNKATGENATIGGGWLHDATGYAATVCGGGDNTASGTHSTVAGGFRNISSGQYTAISGGSFNTASGNYGVVAGGNYNLASGPYSGIVAGIRDTAVGYYAFATNSYSKVPSGYNNSAAFNGQTATASNQLRCGTLSKSGGSFTIDHPLDPYNKILNHYFVESPQMPNLYYGSVVIGANGRAEVRLPDYFSALNRNPMVQLTGVGTANVYLAEDINGNRFVIAGPPGTKVYWTAMGERQDVAAEAIRRLMPVEQIKNSELRGRMLDDEFLAGCMEQLEREGKAEGLNFRTTAGKERYEALKKIMQQESAR